MNSELYADMLMNFALPTLDKYVNDETLFQQDGDTNHTTQVSTDLLKLVFSGRFISRNGDIP